jgi:myotubularin-related protein 6/7/8
LESTVLAEERSPVFLQFLDALWQLLQQFPTSFEYNESLLLFLADHQHSALFGNFLCNCSKDRMELGLVGSTQSIWAYVLQRKNEFSQKVLNSYCRRYTMHVCITCTYANVCIMPARPKVYVCMHVCM